MATPEQPFYTNTYAPYQGGPRRALFGQKQPDTAQALQERDRQLVDALLEAGQDLSGQAGMASSYGGGQNEMISSDQADTVMNMAQKFLGGGEGLGATGSLYGETSGLSAGNPWADSLMFEGNFASEVPSASSVEGLFSGGGSAGGGSAAGGSAAGGESALSSAGPWALLAALIAGNESEARQGGYRDEDDKDYAKDVLFGKVSEQDAYNRWIPKLGDDLLGDEGDRFGMQADMGGFFDLLTGDFSNWWDNMKNEGSLSRMFGGDFGSKRDDSLSMKAKARR